MAVVRGLDWSIHLFGEKRMRLPFPLGGRVAIVAGRPGGLAIVCKADVVEPSQVAQLFDMAEQMFGPLHIVVNNAAVLDAKYPTLAQTSDEDWDQTFQVNCKGAFLCSREAAKTVVRGGGGRIINISSSVVGQARPGYGAYTPNKAAVEMMTRILAQELRGTQITANCVAPGPVATDMFFASKSEAAVEAGVKSNPFERLGKVEDVAPLIAFLASGLMLRLFGSMEARFDS